MKKLLAAVSIFFSSPAFAAQNAFLMPEETMIRSTEVGATTAIVLEDFLEYSLVGAKVLALESQYALVERDGKMAILVPEPLYDSKSGIFVSFAGNCQAECGGSGVGGALVGAVGGATSGAQAGASIAGPQGALGGLVIGGIVGGVGGGIAGYEGCKVASGCEKDDDDDDQGEGKEN